MLNGNQSISHYSKPNIAIWLVLSLQAGLLNIGGLFAGHHYVSHVTGFASSFGMALAQGEAKIALMVAGIPTVFLLGAVVSGYFVDIRIKLNKKPKYYITFGIIFILTTVVFLFGITGFFGEFGSDQDKASYSLLILLCFTCGIQNGTISIVSRSVVRTTHLTGITTDLGLGLVRMFYKDKVEINENDERRANWMRVGIISFFISGSALGGIVFTHFGFWGFSIPVIIAGVLFFVMYYSHLRMR